MNRFFASLVATMCFAVAIAEADFSRKLEDSQNNLRFSIGDSDYEVSPFEENWEAAKYYCKHRGMELLSIETEEEQLAIIEATKDIEASLYMSLNDLFEYRSFLWESTGEAYTYQNFLDGVPNPSEFFTCISLGYYVPNKNTRYWFNNFCNVDYRYICEKRRETCSSD